MRIIQGVDVFAFCDGKRNSMGKRGKVKGVAHEGRKRASRCGVTRIVVFDELLVGRRSGVVEALNFDYVSNQPPFSH